MPREHVVLRLPGRRDRTMSQPKKSYDPWRDDQGTHIDAGCRVQQTWVQKSCGALLCRLGKQGVVVSCGHGNRGTRLYVRFDGETTEVTMRPHGVRVIPLTAGHIIGQLEDLRPAPAGDGHA
jgi:hypothetical protein